MNDPLKTCAKKRKYKNRRDAKSAISGGVRKYLHEYRFPVCGEWHLGHRRWAPDDKSCNVATFLDEVGNAEIH